MNTLDLRNKGVKESKYISLTEEEEHNYLNQILFVIALCVAIGVLDFMFFAPRVKAQDEYVLGFPVVHQNDYYCRMIHDQGVSVGTSNKQALKELCAANGVEL